MASPLTGVTSDTIGVSYDCAIGYDTGSTIKMVGYVLKPGTQWTEATDLQDEQHLVQISSPNTTDRFTRYPKASQGDWSGGERQQFLVDATKYYATNGGINPAIPGQLQLLGGLGSTTLAPGTTPVGSRLPIAVDSVNVYASFLAASTNFAFAPLAATPVFTQSSLGNGLQIMDVMPNPGGDGCIIAFNNAPAAANAGLQIVGAGGAISSQLAGDGVVQLSGPSMAYFNNFVWYATANTVASVISQANLGSPPGVGLGTQFFTVPVGDGVLSGMYSTATQLVFTTSGSFNPNQTVTYVYTSDGTVANTSRAARLPGGVVGGAEVNGIVYLLTFVPQSFTSSVGPRYAIYQVDGSSVTVFDDYRNLDPLIFNATTTALPFGGGACGDGRYLYVSFPGIGIRAYDLTTPGNPVFQFGGTPSNAGRYHQVVCSNNSLGLGPVFARSGDGTSLSVGTYAATPTTGALTSSWIDFGAPTVVKGFRSVDIEMVKPVPAGGSVALKYQTDNQTGFPNTLTLATNAIGNLSGVFSNVKASRLQYQLTLTAGGGVSPVVRSVSVKGTLGRTLKCTVSCARNQRLRNQYTAGDDQQGLRAQDKLANIQNAYQQTAGVVTAFIPSPTQSSGVEQIQAVIEDYTWQAFAEPGPYNTEYGSLDMEGTLDLTLVESL